MLRKLIKYDMKSLGRILLPLYLATFVVGLVSALISRASELSTFTLFDFSRNLFSVLSTTIFVFLFVGTLIMSIVLSILRFKQNLLGKEGYLTNSLPISTDKQIVSKTFSATLWQIITLIFAGISLVLFIMVRYGTGFDIGAAYRVSYIFPQIFEKIGFGGVLLTGLQLLGFLICAILMMAENNLMFYASMALGHTANNKKVLLSFASYIGFYLLSQVINIFAITNYAKIADKFNWGIFTKYSTHFEGYLPVFLPLLAYSLFYFLLFFFITKYLLSKRLNLE